MILVFCGSSSDGPRLDSSILFTYRFGEFFTCQTGSDSIIDLQCIVSVCFVKELLQEATSFNILPFLGSPCPLPLAEALPLLMVWRPEWLLCRRRVYFSNE